MPAPQGTGEERNSGAVHLRHAQIQLTQSSFRLHVSITCMNSGTLTSIAKWCTKVNTMNSQHSLKIPRMSGLGVTALKERWIFRTHFGGFFFPNSLNLHLNEVASRPISTSVLLIALQPVPPSVLKWQRCLRDILLNFADKQLSVSLLPCWDVFVSEMARRSVELRSVWRRNIYWKKRSWIWYSKKQSSAEMTRQVNLISTTAD